ncbi:MAG: hypothetical protein ACTSRU_19770 [Candidatus Hodarchaeales archaeon]
MTFIFGGIDLPEYELILIISVMLLVGLVFTMIVLFYVLRELKHLKKLLKEEEIDIDEFERDIAELEQYEGKKIKDGNNQDIKKYIKNAMDNGFKWEQIKKQLQGQGWDDKDLENIRKEI